MKSLKLTLQDNINSAPNATYVFLECLIMAEILLLTYYAILFSIDYLISVYLLYLLNLIYYCMITRKQYILSYYLPE